MAGEVLGKNILEIFDESPVPENIDLGSLVYVSVKSGSNYSDGATTLAAFARKMQRPSKDWDATPIGDPSMLPDFENESVTLAGGDLIQVNTNHWRAVFQTGQGLGGFVGAASASLPASSTPEIQVEAPTGALQVIAVVFNATATMADIAAEFLDGNHQTPKIGIGLFNNPGAEIPVLGSDGTEQETLSGTNMGALAGSTITFRRNANGTVTVTAGGTGYTSSFSSSLSSDVKIGVMIGYMGDGEALTGNVYPVGDFQEASFPAGTLSGDILNVTAPGTLNGKAVKVGDKIFIGENHVHVQRALSNEETHVLKSTYDAAVPQLGSRVSELEVAGEQRFFRLYMEEDPHILSNLSAYAGARLELVKSGATAPGILELDQSAWGSIPDQTEITIVNSFESSLEETRYVVLTGYKLPALGVGELRIPYGETLTIKKVENLYIDVGGLLGTTSINEWVVVSNNNEKLREDVATLKMPQSFTRFSTGQTTIQYEPGDIADKFILLSPEEEDFTVSFASGAGINHMSKGQKTVICNVTNIDTSIGTKPFNVACPSPYGTVKLYPGQYVRIDHASSDINIAPGTPDYIVTSNAILGDVVDTAVFNAIGIVDDPDSVVPRRNDGVPGIEQSVSNGARFLVFDTQENVLVSRNLQSLREWVRVKNNTNASVNPGPNDDETQGYEEGSKWKNSVANEWFICSIATEGAADWQPTTLSVDELGSLALLDDAPNDGGIYARRNGQWEQVSTELSEDNETLIWQGI